MSRFVTLVVLLAALTLFAAVEAQQVMAPTFVPPGAPLPRYVYNVIAADFSTPAGQPLIKSKFSVYDPVGPTVQQFDANLAKMGELNLNTYRLELAWGRRSGLGTSTGVGGTADKLVYDFQGLDHLVKQLHTQDVQLLGSFGYTPVPLQDVNGGQPGGPTPGRGGEAVGAQSVAGARGGGGGRGGGSAPPKDLGKWKEAVAAFVRHYKEIGIPFGVNEVWNEPDGTYGFFRGTEAEYEQLYKATVEAIRGADPDATVAGPGSDHHLLWNMTFIDFVAANKLPLDYYSFHEYGSGELAVRQVERTESSINRYPALNTAALSLDEWHDGECCTWCNDDVRNHYEGAPELLHDFMLLLDRPELASVSWAWWEDPGGRGAGCMGLVTGDGRRKAVFNAWKLYAMMPVDRRHVHIEGDLEAAASSDEHKASVLVWNRGSYDRRVDVHLKHLPFRAGTVRMYRIDGKHASPTDGAEENLAVTETYPVTAADGWSYLDATIPKYGILYFEATDGTGVSELTPARVGNVIRTDRYYPARGKTKSYADFDRKTWIARLGMMDETAADQEIGVLADGLPDALDAVVKVEGKLQKLDGNSLLGIRLDYRMEGKYAKAVWLHGPYGGVDLFDRKRTAAMPWGLKRDVDQVVAVPDLAGFRIPLKTYAPSGWDGKVHISFVMENAGPGVRAKIMLRAAK
jgi:xylan 1,4-beta-xylosidase